MRDFWVENILYLREHLSKQPTEDKITSKVKWNDLDKETMTKIKLEVEKDHLEKISL